MFNPNLFRWRVRLRFSSSSVSCSERLQLKDEDELCFSEKVFDFPLHSAVTVILHLGFECRSAARGRN